MKDKNTLQPVCPSARLLMQHALGLAARGLGNVWPNPAVGCVIVKDGVVIGRGWTQPGGRPHAEAMALAQAGVAAQGADLFVTLEPCCQPGRGPACSDGMIAAGIKNVFIAMSDPHPRVDGQGIAALRAAGMHVVTSLCADDARELNKGFLSVVENHRPMVTLKMAVSADWKMTTGNAAQPWITGGAARHHGHRLRATHDAILVGMGTVIADDPMLDCRISGMEKFSPVRVVLSRNQTLPPESKLAKTSDKIPVWVHKEATIPDVLKSLADKGITRLLVEGGARVAQSFLDAGVVDEVVIYQAPHEVGIVGLVAPKVPENFELQRSIKLEDDILHQYGLSPRPSCRGDILFMCHYT